MHRDCDSLDFAVLWPSGGQVAGMPLPQTRSLSAPSGYGLDRQHRLRGSNVTDEGGQ